MKQWKINVSLILSAIVIAVLGIFIHQLSSFPIKESYLEKHIIDQVNKSENTSTKIDIQEIKDIGNVKTLLFLVHEGDMSTSNPRLGFAFYEKSRLGKYRFNGAGWSTNMFDSYLFEASVKKKKEKFLVVYGRNPSETKEFERFRVKFHDEVFVGNLSHVEYFVEVFPVTNSSDENVVTDIKFETKDYFIESYPLMITNKIK